MDIQQNMRRIIQHEAEAIQSIEVTPAFAEAVKALQTCEGKVITTGIGKAGFIAHKLASVLSSTGTPACYIHPAEAGHGDLGLLNDKDCIIALSTSGKSTEVIEMLKSARMLGVAVIIGVTSHADSPLRKLSDIVLDMGSDIEEACPLKLTPSATIAVIHAISDAIALTLLSLKNFTRQDYGRRHHAGYLGQVTRLQGKELQDP